MYSNSIQNNSNNVKEKNPLQPPQEIYLSKACWRFYDLLSGCRNLYNKENKLAKDGSFYKANEFFEKRISVSERWVHYMKITLKEKGLIDYAVQPGRGHATKYWILDKQEKSDLETTPQPQEKQPIQAGAVRQMVAMKGKEWTLNCQAFKAYSRTEIEACFDT